MKVLLVFITVAFDFSNTTSGHPFERGCAPSYFNTIGFPFRKYVSMGKKLFLVV
jgi:hypothetical protein